MQTMGELIERNARYFPEREAFIYGERRLTHGQFAARSKSAAAGFEQLGLNRQDRFAVLAMNCLEYYELFGAAEVSGLIAALLNFRLATPELVQVLKDCAPRALVFEEQYTSVVAQLRELCPDVTHYVCIGEAPTWATSYESLVASGAAAGLSMRAHRDDYVYLYYTSGTTGKAKGVAWRQYKALENARVSAESIAASGDLRVLQITPAFHIGGKGFPSAALWVGGAVVLDRSFDATRMLEIIQKEKVTFTFMVAAMVQAVLEVPDVGSYDVSSIRTILSAAAPIPVPLLKRAIALLGPVFTVQYGCTEVGMICGLPMHEVNPDGTPEQVKRLASVGHPVASIDLRLLDDDGNLCPPGKPGEVVIRGITQLDGYWNNSIATVEAIRDGWYHTGDIGISDEQGYIFLVDRKKDMIISGGENIYSREVESALAEHPEVADVAVIGVPDPRWVETVKAVVVLKRDAAVTESELIAHCKTLIASYKCPKTIAFMPELPRLPSGKINKVELRALHRC